MYVRWRAQRSTECVCECVSEEKKTFVWVFKLGGLMSEGRQFFFMILARFSEQKKKIYPLEKKKIALAFAASFHSA